jgi:hypothetical protein
LANNNAFLRETVTRLAGLWIEPIRLASLRIRAARLGALFLTRCVWSLQLQRSFARERRGTVWNALDELATRLSSWPNIPRQSCVSRGCLSPLSAAITAVGEREE